MEGDAMNLKGSICVWTENDGSVSLYRTDRWDDMDQLGVKLKGRHAVAIFEAAIYQIRETYEEAQ
jgi:hypothetical protein